MKRKCKKELAGKQIQSYRSVT